MQNCSGRSELALSGEMQLEKRVDDATVLQPHKRADTVALTLSGLPVGRSAALLHGALSLCTLHAAAAGSFPGNECLSEQPSLCRSPRKSCKI